MDEYTKTVELIKNTLEKIRPFINRDGGDVIFDSFEDGIVYVNMLGACQDCMMLDSTLTDGIEVILLEEVPGVLGVKLVKDKPTND